MIDYKILTAKTSKELESEVKLYLSRGWRLHGPTQFYSAGRSISFVSGWQQVVIKEADG